MSEAGLTGSGANSANNVERLGVRPVVPRQLSEPLIPPPEITPEMLKSVADAAAQRAAGTVLATISSGLVSTWMGIGTVLAIRLLLLLTLAGGFTLAVMAMQAQTNLALAVMIAYAVLVILPMVYLSQFGRGNAS